MSCVRVAAGAIFGADGRLLISRRAIHQHQGGLWEFPGGKIEDGESVETALSRELEEELGIVPLRTRPLIQIPFQYPDKRVELNVLRVDTFAGEPHGREGQPLRWVAIDDLQPSDFPAANRPIVSALQLPAHYLITGDFADAQDLERRVADALLRGIRLLQLRAPDVTAGELNRLAAALRGCCRAAGARLVVNGDPRALDPRLADGVHLNRHRLFDVTPADLLAWRTDLHQRLVGASCHNPDELRRAVELGVDYLFLSPLLPTSSHPEALGLGWQTFADWVRNVPLPVYALGGLQPADLTAANEAGGQGIAAISAFWPD